MMWTTSFLVRGWVSKLDEHDLLPGAMDDMAVMNWDGEAWPEDTCTDMGSAVIIVPCLVMIVRDVLRCEPFKCPREIFQQAGFVFHGCDRTGGAWYENARKAFIDMRFADELFHRIGEVDDLSLFLCMYGQFIVIHAHECFT